MLEKLSFSESSGTFFDFIEQMKNLKILHQHNLLPTATQPYYTLDPNCWASLAREMRKEKLWYMLTWVCFLVLPVCWAAVRSVANVRRGEVYQQQDNSSVAQNWSQPLSHSSPATNLAELKGREWTKHSKWHHIKLKSSQSIDDKSFISLPCTVMRPWYLSLPSEL